MSEVPLRPDEVLDDRRIQYQLMDPLPDEKYRRLADDIRENGVNNPVVVDDSDPAVIIDGHHREAIATQYELSDEKQPEHDVRPGLTPNDKRALGVKLNIMGRDTTESKKCNAVENYIRRSWDRTDDGDLIRPETDSEVAEKLGVSRQLVSQVINSANGGIIYHERLDAQEYYEENPDASYREVARQVDASQPTVTEWLKEDFDEGDSDEPDDEQEILVSDTASETQTERSVEAFMNGVREAEKDTESAPNVSDAQSESETDKNDEPTPEVPETEYDVVYADPPWRYNFSKTSNREIENQYETMDLSEIKALDMPVEDDAVLYLWATAPKLPQAMAVMREWGFDYTTNLVWDKEQMGMGYWSRVQHEHLLIGTIGDVSPPESGERRRSIVREQRGEHSEKPEAVADMIAEQHPNGELIELFARDEREGWDVWGNEAPSEVADD